MLTIRVVVDSRELFVKDAEERRTSLRFLSGKLRRQQQPCTLSVHGMNQSSLLLAELVPATRRVTLRSADVSRFALEFEGQPATFVEISFSNSGRVNSAKSDTVARDYEPQRLALTAQAPSAPDQAHTLPEVDPPGSAPVPAPSPPPALRQPLSVEVRSAAGGRSSKSGPARQPQRTILPLAPDPLPIPAPASPAPVAPPADPPPPAEPRTVDLFRHGNNVLMGAIGGRATGIGDRFRSAHGVGAAVDINVGGIVALRATRAEDLPDGLRVFLVQALPGFTLLVGGTPTDSVRLVLNQSHRAKELHPAPNG